MFEHVSPFQTVFASTTSVYLVLNKTRGFFRLLLPESFTVGKGVQNKISFFFPLAHNAPLGADYMRKHLLIRL